MGLRAAVGNSESSHNWLRSPLSRGSKSLIEASNPLMKPEPYFDFC